MHKYLSSGDLVYGKRAWNDDVLYFIDSVEYTGIIEAIFVHYAQVKSRKLVIIRCLDHVDSDDGNAYVVHKCGKARYICWVSTFFHISIASLLAKDLLRPGLLVIEHN